MNIIITAYDCNPQMGSEAGLGWNWVKAAQAENRFEKIFVITTTIHESAIREYLSQNKDLNKVEFHFVERPLENCKINQRFKYILWQREIVRTINDLCANNVIDIVHHVTWATYILPLALHKCKRCKIIVGPVGGGEAIPQNVDLKISLKNRFVEWIRITLATVAPYVLNYKTLEFSMLIYATTEETKRRLPKKFWKKVKILQSIGAEDSRISTSMRTVRDENKTFKVLMVGRFLYWKGINIGLKAIKELLEEGYDLQLTVVGDGKEDFMSDYSNVEGIIWHKHVDYHKMDLIYDESDVLLNCSLHDSGCMVILEAMSRQLPVICIDAGGPKVLTDYDCAIKIAPNTLEELNKSIKAAIVSAIQDRKKFATLGVKGNDRVIHKFLYSQKYREILNDYDALNDTE